MTLGNDYLYTLLFVTSVLFFFLLRLVIRIQVNFRKWLIAIDG
jgi:hypothetical protein